MDQTHKGRSHRILGWTLVFLFLISLSFLITYPSSLKPEERVFGLSEWPGDRPGVLYGLWTYLTERPEDEGQRLRMLGAPFGVDLSSLPSHSVWDKVIRLLTKGLGDEVLTYNILIVIGFLGISILSFFLLREIGLGFIPSLFGACAFGYSPFFTSHALVGHHFGVVTLAVPLYFLFLVRLLRRKSVFDAIGAGLGIALASFHFYFAYFLLVLSFVALLGVLSFSKKNTEMSHQRGWPLGYWALVLFIATLGILPFTYRLILSVLGYYPVEGVEWIGYRRGFHDLFGYSARIYDYLIPSELSAFLGGLSKRFFEDYFHGGRHYFEKSLYIGIVPTVLATYGVLRWRRMDKIQESQYKWASVMPLLIFLSVITVFLSRPPYISLGILELPTSTALLYQIAPMFRVYARFGMIVMLCVTVLAGIGLSLWLESLKSWWKKSALVTMVFIGLFFEFSIVPPFRTVSLTTPDPIYQWLKGQPGDFIIAEYPILHPFDPRFENYKDAQRHHGKRMVNGAMPGTFAAMMLSSLDDLTHPEVPSYLAHFGVGYAIVHKDFYYPEQISQIQRQKGIKSIREEGNLAIYEVIAEPAPIVIANSGFYREEKWEDGKIWRWMAKEGVLIIDTDRAVSLKELSFFAQSFVRPRTVNLLLNGKVLKNFTAKAGEKVRVQLVEIQLERGINRLAIQMNPGPEVIAETLGNNDNRSVSVAIGDFNLVIGNFYYRL